MSKKKYSVFYTYDGEHTHEGSTDDPKAWLKDHNLTRISENMYDEEGKIAYAIFKKTDDLEEMIELAVSEHGMDREDAEILVDDIDGIIEDEDEFTFYEV